jgi:hypothetical protein
MPRVPMSQALAHIAKFFKAVPDGQIDDLMDALTPNVTSRGSDQWAQPGFVTDDQRRLAFGPSEAASGSGASQMTNEYSTPGPSTGSSDRASRIGVLLDELKSLLQTPGSRPTSGNVGGETFLGKAGEQLRAAKSVLLKADLTDDADKRAAGISEAKRLLDKASALLEDACNDADESEQEDQIGKCINRLKGLNAKVASMSGTTGSTNANAFGVRPGMSVDQFLNKLAGTSQGAPSMQKAGTSGISMPPDMNTLAKGGVSVSQRVNDAIESGMLNGDEAIEAETMLQHYHLAMSGRVPVGHFTDTLAKARSQRVVECFGVRAIPARVELA